MAVQQLENTAESFDVLMRELRFTEQDLEANRNGYLSERQREYIEIDRRKNIVLGIGIVVVFIIATATMLYFGIQNRNLILQGLGVVMVFCNTGASLLFGLNWVRSTYDLNTNEVSHLEGEVQHVVRQFGRAQAGSVRVGGRIEVATTPEAFTAFVPGKVYRVYRSSHTKRILSVETVD